MIYRQAALRQTRMAKNNGTPKLTNNRKKWEMFSFINLQLRISTIDHIDKEVVQLITKKQQAAEESSTSSNNKLHLSFSITNETLSFQFLFTTCHAFYLVFNEASRG